jgi:hypothetical protein
MLQQVGELVALGLLANAVELVDDNDRVLRVVARSSLER